MNVMQEAIALGVFAAISMAFLGEPLRWTCFTAMGCLVMAAVFIPLPRD